MPFAQLSNARIHYELSGSPDAPVLVLSHSLGVNLAMWNPQLPAFSKHFRVLRYDTRGHGASSVPLGDYSIAMLGEDLLELLDALKINQAHFCGLSMGGMIGMWLGANASHRFGKIVLSNTAVKIGTPETWAARIAAVRSKGMCAVAPSIIERWFTYQFRADSPDVVAEIQRIIETGSPQGYIACCAAIRDMDFTEGISAVRLPVLVISGIHDPGTTPAAGRFIVDHIPGAQYAERNASHLSNVEDSQPFTAGVLRFLTGKS